VAANLQQLQRRLGIKFRSAEFLAEALVHRSYLNEAPHEGVASNERLEFLGDAVLGLVVARWLFERFPDLPEGQLTRLRAAIVKWESLARVAARFDLGAYLVLGRGEEATGGRSRPQTMARTVEAIIGAVFLDKGFAATERWLLKLLDPELDALRGGELADDAKSRLQHAAQRYYSTTPRYHVVSAIGPDHEKTFTIEVLLEGRPYGRGVGKTKRVAEQQAAEEALAAIRSERPDGTVEV
jgi:ribonuclease III